MIDGMNIDIYEKKGRYGYEKEMDHVARSRMYDSFFVGMRLKTGGAAGGRVSSDGGGSSRRDDRSGFCRKQ